MELKNIFVQDALGNVVPSPKIYVYQPGTTTLATGLKNVAGGDLANPFDGTPQGQAAFRAPDGEYDLRAVGSGRDFTMRVRFIDAVEYGTQLSERRTGAQLLADTGEGFGYTALRGAAAAKQPMTVREAMADEADLWTMLTPAQRSAIRSDSMPDVTAALQAIINAANGGEGMFSGAAGGTTLKLRAGRMKCTDGLTSKFRETNAIVDDRDLRRMNIEGGGANNTEINFVLGAGKTAIDIRGYNNADGRLLGSHIRGVRLTQNPIGARLATAIRLDTVGGFTLEDVKISGFDLGLYCRDVLEFKAFDLHLLGNTVGMRAEKGVWTYPNVFQFHGGAVSGNYSVGAHIKNGASVAFHGTRFEGNGINRATDYALFMEGAPMEGRAWLTVDDGCYFEGNKVASDIFLAKTGGGLGAVVIANNTFNQADGDRYSAVNINMFGDSGARCPVIIMANGVLAANSYVPGSGKFYNVQSDHFEVHDIGNTLDHAADGPVTNGFAVANRGMFHEAVRALIVNAGTPDVAADRNGNISAVALEGGATGRVRITFRRPMANTNFMVDASPYNAVGRCVVSSPSQNGITIETRDGTDALANMPFNVSIYGDFG